MEPVCPEERVEFLLVTSFLKNSSRALRYCVQYVHFWECGCLGRRSSLKIADFCFSALQMPGQGPGSQHSIPSQAIRAVVVPGEHPN